MIKDPVVEEVRRVRKAIEAACGNDPVKYAEHLRQVEQKYADRLVRLGPKPALRTRAVAEGKAAYGPRKAWHANSA